MALRYFFPAGIIGRMGKPPLSEWGRRAQAAGLDQKTLALLAGTDATTVSRGLNGRFATVPIRLYSIIVVWEMLPPECRQAWVSTVRDLSAQS